jgi:hypothetical protein
VDVGRRFLSPLEALLRPLKGRSSRDRVLLLYSCESTGL